MVDDQVRALAARVLEAYKARGWTIATAESCTGGLVAGSLTEIAGSSAVVDRGFVTYSNEAKAEMLGVPEAILIEHGAVSRPVAEAMAKGVLTRSSVDASVSITGVAGPGGGSAEKPVGFVCFAWASGGPVKSESCRFSGDREAVRRQSVVRALEGVLQILDSA